MQFECIFDLRFDLRSFFLINIDDTDWDWKT